MPGHDADADLAAKLAAQAGEAALVLRSSGRFDGDGLGREGDRLAHDLLLRGLSLHRPGDTVLSEEGPLLTADAGRGRVWIVDPIDGTSEFAEGRCDWAVHVALAVDGEPVCGAVALPSRGLVLRSDRPRSLASPASRPRIAVSRNRPPPAGARLAAALDGDVLPMGSAGAKAMAVLLGEAEIYLHAGGQRLWDSCAPVAVARASGLHCSRLDGSRLRYDPAEVDMPDLLICHPQFAAAALAAIRDGS
ncbi:3'(2'),5'-bisphosphate nucleotidase CysQ [Erythrobacteraceae bacterium CFH 75059]|uniref:3'(2'),5'-bisphosphate nucleotidase CysQ n=1 Tax=Qipengyuania thermophila TaxID=2509361 RepID=UPI0010222AD0|nr:3'(2'),5'-bisphosphate nucleotidase CysQ [Qipengyuania thermophila]TCD04895.1 3'(2'),5'-bisphosphate nucleotidase CysQ [Erythrobacteraceae bacterium CFH 75059]